MVCVCVGVCGFFLFLFYLQIKTVDRRTAVDGWMAVDGRTAVDKRTAFDERTVGGRTDG